MKSIHSFTDNVVSEARRAFYAVADGVGTALALSAAVLFHLGWHGGVAYLQQHKVAMLLSWGAFMIALGMGRMYESSLTQSLGKTVAALVLSVGVGMLLIAGVFFVARCLEPGSALLVGFGAFVLITAIRLRLLNWGIHHLGFMTKRCLVLGTDEMARKAIALVDNHPHAGIEIVGLVEAHGKEGVVGDNVGGHPVLGAQADLEQLVRTHRIEQLILASQTGVDPSLPRRLRSFRYRGVALVDYVSLHEQLTKEISIDHITEEWLLGAAMHSSRFHIRYMKRLTDLGVALVGLLLAAPFMLVVAILIKLDSRGPVFYRQQRLGRDAVPFEILKFRTMRQDAEKLTGAVWASENDPRITRVGKWLRTFRIDEIPQLVNVLRGEVSLIGPRPKREEFVRELTHRIPFYPEHMLVHPGLTGWAQVTQPYADSVEYTFRKVQADLYYIKHMSFFMDMYILFKTIQIVALGRERRKMRPSKEVGVGEPGAPQPVSNPA